MHHPIKVRPIGNQSKELGGISPQMAGERGEVSLSSHHNEQPTNNHINPHQSPDCRKCVLTPVNIFLISSEGQPGSPDQIEPAILRSPPEMSLKVLLSLTASRRPGDHGDTSDPAMTRSLTQTCCFAWSLSAKFILPILLATNRFALENFLLNKLPQLSLVLA